MTGKITKLPPSAVRVDPAIQQRAGGVDESYAAELAAIITAGGTFRDRPVVFCDPNDPASEYWLAGGFHRQRAAVLAKVKQLDYECRPGTRRDALQYALGDNADHGRPRSNDDKRKSVATALADPEWSRFSDRQIDELCRVSFGLTSRIRKELTGAAPDAVKSAAAAKGNDVLRANREREETQTTSQAAGQNGRADRRSVDVRGGPAQRVHAPRGADRPQAASQVRDRLGRPVPARLVESFKPENAGEGGPLCYVCPACDGDKDETECPTCHGGGGLNETQYNLLSPLLKEQAEFRAREESAAAPKPETWRGRPVKEIVRAGSTLLGKFHLENIATLGNLADRFDRGDTLGLIPGVLDDLRESLSAASQGEWPKADGLGRPIPAKLRDAFADTYLSDVANRLRSDAAKLKAASSWNPWIKPNVWDDLTRLAAEIEGDRAFAVCSCGGSGCEGCLTGGFLPAWQGPELKQQAKRK